MTCTRRCLALFFGVMTLAGVLNSLANPYQRTPHPPTQVALRDGHRLINDHPTKPGSVAQSLPTTPPSPGGSRVVSSGPAVAAACGEVLHVATVDQLLTAVDRVGPGGTILLADGHDRLPRTIVLQGKRDIALRGASGDPSRVTVSGQGWDSQTQGDDIVHVARCEGVTMRRDLCGLPLLRDQGGSRERPERRSHLPLPLPGYRRPGDQRLGGEGPRHTGRERSGAILRIRAAPGSPRPNGCLAAITLPRST